MCSVFLPSLFKSEKPIGHRLMKKKGRKIHKIKQERKINIKGTSSVNKPSQSLNSHAHNLI